MTPLLTLDAVSKRFKLHLRDGAELSVVRDVSFSVAPGECVVLGGPSGVGKSSLLKIIFGNYRCNSGRILLRDGAETVDLAAAEPRRILALRRTTLGYVSQFLRVIPRIGTLDIVAAAGRESGVEQLQALGDERPVPPRAVLPGQWDERPVGRRAGRPTGIGQEHQREQSRDLRVVPGLAVQHPGQPDRLAREVDA